VVSLISRSSAVKLALAHGRKRLHEPLGSDAIGGTEVYVVLVPLPLAAIPIQMLSNAVVVAAVVGIPLAV
jgi:hypothetical protein